MNTSSQLSIPRYDYDDLVEMNDVFSNDSAEVLRFLDNLKDILNSASFSNNYEISKLKVYLAELNVSNFWEHVSVKHFNVFACSLTNDGLKLVECFIPDPTYSSNFKHVIDQIFSKNEKPAHEKMQTHKRLGSIRKKIDGKRNIMKGHATSFSKASAGIVAGVGIAADGYASSDMNKVEFISSLAKHTGTTQAQAGEFVNAFCDTVVSELKKGNGVAIPGFGQFIAKHRPSREMRNPATGKMMMSKAKTAAQFKASAKLKNL